MSSTVRRDGEWTTWPDLLERLRRRWQRGDFLRAHAAKIPFDPVELPIRAPGPRDIGTRFDDVRAWHSGWQKVPAGVQVRSAPVGGRLIGVNQLPIRAVVGGRSDLWAVLGVRREVAAFDELLAATQERAPSLADWMVDHPMRVIPAAAHWDLLVSTVLWIARAARPGSYLREIDVPGVDTKFIETHRGLLGELLDHQLPPERIDTSRPRADFAGRYGFREKPGYIRVRLPPEAGGAFSEFAVRVEELAASPLPARTVVVVENEITYLAMPSTPGAAVLLGDGYAIGRLSPLVWLADRDVQYWGDIDTHGFVILDRLRGAFPHVRSLLMDRPTLLAHRSQWVHEPTPVSERLDRLTADEAELYTDLVMDAYGPSVRLEQERVRLSLVEEAQSAWSG